MKLFDQSVQNEEILILDGQPFKAYIAYQKNYNCANIKGTLVHLTIINKMLMFNDMGGFNTW